jgi:hypothetical protein
MRQNNKNRRNRQAKQKSILMRCKTHSKPVFGHEVCSRHLSKNTTDNKKSCDNCISSF